MALELLAGPYQLHDKDGAPMTLNACWYSDESGILGHSLGKLYAIQLDGLMYRRANTDYYCDFISDFKRPGHNLIEKTGHIAKGNYEMDMHSGARLLPAVTAEYADVGDARLSDRFIDIWSNRVNYRPLDLSADWVTESTFSVPGITGYHPTVSPTGDERILCFIYNTGWILYYDHVSKTLVGDVKRVSPHTWGFYSPKFDIFITVDAILGSGTHSVRVWAPTPLPAAVSVPVAVTPILKGKVSQIQVRITGSDGEPCPDETVTWTLTGANPLADAGSLTSLQSISNSDGYAYTGYSAPVDSLPTVNIAAEVRF